MRYLQAHIVYTTIRSTRSHAVRVNNFIFFYFQVASKLSHSSAFVEIALKFNIIHNNLHIAFETEANDIRKHFRERWYGFYFYHIYWINVPSTAYAFARTPILLNLCWFPLHINTTAKPANEKLVYYNWYDTQLDMTIKYATNVFVFVLFVVRFIPFSEISIRSHYALHSNRNPLSVTSIRRTLSLRKKNKKHHTYDHTDYRHIAIRTLHTSYGTITARYCCFCINLE